jgi:hypothetical protein
MTEGASDFPQLQPVSKTRSTGSHVGILLRLAVRAPTAGATIHVSSNGISLVLAPAEGFCAI